MSLEAKHVAAVAAGEANDVAAELAILAGVVGLGAWYTGVGGGISAVLAIGSGVAWWIGNEYSDLSVDPPRHDYHIATKYNSKGTFALPKANNNIEAVFNNFITTQVEIANAISVLITSFERLDGARIDLRKPNATSQALSYRIMKQREAIKHNANIARKEIEYLIYLREQINFAWRLNAQLVKSYNVNIDNEIDRKLVIDKTISDTKPVLENIIKNPKLVEKALTFIAQGLYSNKNKLSEVLLDDKWLKGMQDMKKQLGVFVGLRFLDQKKVAQMYYL